MSKKGRSSIFGGIEEYCRAIERIKPMTRDEEVACATALRDTGDQRFARKLVDANLLPTMKFVLRYSHFGLPIADLIQEGNLGLLRAVQKYDVSLGNRFMTYARWHVRARVHRYLQNNWRMVMIKKGRSWRKLLNIAFSSIKMLQIKRDADVEGVSFFELLGTKIGASAEEAEEMLFVFGSNEIRLDQLTSVEGEVSDTDISQLERSLSLFGIAQEDDPVREFLAAEKASLDEEQVGFALNTLSELERLIIRRRFLRSRQWKLQEIGDDVGYTKERIRQLQNGALEKLRKYFINEPYKGGEKEG